MNIQPNQVLFCKKKVSVFYDKSVPNLQTINTIYLIMKVLLDFNKV